MNDSTTPAAAGRTTDGGYIQAAHRRVAEMRTWEAEVMEAPTASELEKALGEPVGRLTRLTENWRNRVYRVELASGEVAFAKQVVMATDAMLQYQYGQLRVLAELQIPGLRVPRPLGLLRAKRTFVMEFARGKAIPGLVWDRARADDLFTACELAGKILAQIHMARTQKVCRTPVEALARDLATAPWRLSARQQDILRAALENLSAAEVALGEVYYDYKAANLLFENGQLFLVDPPDVERQGVLLWDFACFCSSMRRHLWRFSLRRPFARRRRAMIKQSLSIFEQGYLLSSSRPPLEPALFASAVRLFELQRTALLMTMQEGKIDLARQKRPIARDAFLGHSFANRLTVLFLDVEKRWLFHQLARELP